MTRHTTITMLMALALVGAGCGQATSQPGPLDGIEASLDALGDAKDLASGATKSARKQADLMTNDLPVAMIVTEGADVPEGAELTGGTIGCNDRVAFTRVSRETDSGNVSQDALATLFSVKDTNHAGLYNALAYSDLRVERVSLVGDGVVEAAIVGETSMGGACDAPRFKAQVEETVRQYEKDVRVLLNGTESAWRCLGDQSGECE